MGSTPTGGRGVGRARREPRPPTSCEPSTRTRTRLRRWEGADVRSSRSTSQASGPAPSSGRGSPRSRRLALRPPAHAEAEPRAPLAISRRGRPPRSAAPSRFGFLGRYARRGLYRVLRPYTSRRAEFDAAVVDGLVELRELLAASLEQGLRAEQHQRAILAVDDRAADAGPRSAYEPGRAAHPRPRRPREPSRPGPRCALGRAARRPVSLGSGVFPHDRLPRARGVRVHGLDEPPAERNGYLGFEDIFRGSEEFIRDRQRAYVDILAGGSRCSMPGAGGASSWSF